MKNPVSNHVEWFTKQVEALEQEFNVRKRQLFGKLPSCCVPTATEKRKPGRPPKDLYRGLSSQRWAPRPEARMKKLKEPPTDFDFYEEKEAGVS